MNHSRILRLMALSALLLSACNSSDDPQELATCSPSEPCVDMDTVCVNHYCVPKCTENTCLNGQICGPEGICIANTPVEPAECSDTNPCTTGECVEGKCTEPQETSECSDTNPCDGDKICESGKCVECSENKACSVGKLCKSGVCIIDPNYSAGTCTTSEDCNDNNLTCKDGKCIAKCKSSEECNATNVVCDLDGLCVAACNTGLCKEGYVCEGRVRICVPGECSWYDDCQSGFVCDLENHKCLQRCSAGSCETGKVCDDEGFCVEGECSKIDRTCTDTNKVCDVQNMKCIDKCTDNDDCETGKLCDTTGLCVSPCVAGSCEAGFSCMPNGLCVEAECSVIDQCSISYKVCVDNHCIDKCKSNKDCNENQICDSISKICYDRCTATSCGTGQVCADDGTCVTGTCSTLTPCPQGQVCTGEHKCTVPKTMDNDCYFYKDCGSCDDVKENCISKCVNAEDDKNTALQACETARANCINDYTTCETNKRQCDENALSTYNTLVERCGNVIACKTLTDTLESEKNACETAKSNCTQDETSCENTYQDCIANAESAFDAGKSVCESNRCSSELDSCLKTLNDCEARNKPCPDGKQCNAYNQCIDSATANGLGLGAICDDGNGNKQTCADGLICYKKSLDSKSYCLQAAYAQDRKECTTGAFKDKCEGNIIVECDDATGLVLVQDCKTSYIDYSTPTTGIFHGDNFYCMKMPNSSYVSCTEKCDTLGSEKNICGWDIDDSDIDYSDRYVCQYNQEGLAGYFPVDSEVCSSTCDYYSGHCD